MPKRVFSRNAKIPGIFPVFVEEGECNSLHTGSRFLQWEFRRKLLYFPCQFFPRHIMRLFTFLTVFLLTACAPLLTDREVSAPPSTPPEAVKEEAAEVIREEANNMMVMHHTEALDEGCESLTAKTAEEKKGIIADIGHNMDKDALEMILGGSCVFVEAVEVSDITEDDLKLNPEDTETLYFLPETNQFFVTCKSMNTVAYVVDRLTEDDPEEFFHSHKSKFVAAAKVAKDMMMDMGEDEDGGPGENEASAMSQSAEEEEAADKEGDEVNEKPEKAMKAKTKGLYVDAFSNIEIANAAIGDGKPVALFFYASWCGYCQTKDALLKKMYEEGSFTVSIYRVNYDEADDLKTTYGITAQDAVVLIDGEGNALQTVMGATEDDLRAMLSSG
jgi:thiol-disulfide isomerase/thioredoxin